MGFHTVQSLLNVPIACASLSQAKERRTSQVTCNCWRHGLVLKASGVLSENLGIDLYIHMAAQTICNFSSSSSNRSFMVSGGSWHAHGAYTHLQVKHFYTESSKDYCNPCEC